MKNVGKILGFHIFFWWCACYFWNTTLSVASTYSNLCCLLWQSMLEFGMYTPKVSDHFPILTHSYSPTLSVNSIALAYDSSVILTSLTRVYRYNYSIIMIYHKHVYCSTKNHFFLSCAEKPERAPNLRAAWHFKMLSLVSISIKAGTKHGVNVVKIKLSNELTKVKKGLSVIALG